MQKLQSQSTLPKADVIEKGMNVSVSKRFLPCSFLNLLEDFLSEWHQILIMFVINTRNKLSEYNFDFQLLQKGRNKNISVIIKEHIPFVWPSKAHSPSFHFVTGGEVAPSAQFPELLLDVSLFPLGKYWCCKFLIQITWIHRTSEAQIQRSFPTTVKTSRWVLIDRATVIQSQPSQACPDCRLYSQFKHFKEREGIPQNIATTELILIL